MKNLTEKVTEVLKKTATVSSKKEKWVAVDFDKTIHSYENGWQDGKIYGTVIPGTIITLQILKEKGYFIAIHTARICENLDENNLNINKVQYDNLANWLNINNIPYDKIIPKFIAEYYIDDRALQFNGNWEEIINKIP